MTAERRVRVGTSGYSYSWNKGKPTPFEWYLAQGFDTVEINASFYRFPTTSWVNVWKRAPGGFTFSIKVHRSITHYTRLAGKVPDLWKRFSAPLRPLERTIEYWLFQMPSDFLMNEENLERLEKFFGGIRLGSGAVVEFRDPSWWEAVEKVEEMGVVFCSVDAPELPRDVVATNGTTYLRLHGRDRWYDYKYSKTLLDEIIGRLRRSPSLRKAVYLNNDHGMLVNGQYLLNRLNARKKEPVSPSRTRERY